VTAALLIRSGGRSRIPHARAAAWVWSLMATGVHRRCFGQGDFRMGLLKRDRAGGASDGALAHDSEWPHRERKVPCRLSEPRPRPGWLLEAAADREEGQLVVGLTQSRTEQTHEAPEHLVRELLA